MSKRPTSPVRLRAVRVALASVAAVVMVVPTAAGPAAAATGTIQIIQGGTGQDSSTPAGIDCTIGPDGPSRPTCRNRVPQPSPRNRNR